MKSNFLGKAALLGVVLAAVIGFTVHKVRPSQAADAEQGSTTPSAVPVADISNLNVQPSNVDFDFAGVKIGQTVSQAYSTLQGQGYTWSSAPSLDCEDMPYSNLVIHPCELTLPNLTHTDSAGNTYTINLSATDTATDKQPDAFSDSVVVSIVGVITLGNQSGTQAYLNIAKAKYPNVTVYTNDTPGSDPDFPPRCESYFGNTGKLYDNGAWQLDSNGGGICYGARSDELDVLITDDAFQTRYQNAVYDKMAAFKAQQIPSQPKPNF